MKEQKKIKPRRVDKKMEINKIPKTNPQYEINKREYNTLLNPPHTNKPKDKQAGITIYPYLSVQLCDNLIYQNVLLCKCLETLTEDTILNDITIQNKNKTINTADEKENKHKEKIIQFWENNQDELKKQIQDYYSYGFSGGEILYNLKTGEPAEIVQIPAETLHIQKETHKNQDGEPADYYYAIQTIVGQQDVKMRIYNEEYPAHDDDLPVCFWLGGGRKSDYYDYPIWISAFNHVSASVSLDLLNAQKLADGNLVSGIITIIKPPTPTREDEQTLDDTLEEKMQNKGSGVFTLELTTLNPNIPLNVDYIKISEDNYTYLNELASNCDEKILAIFKIPKARLLIDDTTESMNSNKTNTLYQIYTIELSNQQRIFENKINKFNKIFFNYDGKINFLTPLFVNERDVQTDSIIKLFNTGLLTLGQAVTQISKIYPEFEKEISELLTTGNPVYNERYYNGNPLGFANDNLENPVTNIGDLLDYFQIN